MTSKLLRFNDLKAAGVLTSRMQLVRLVNNAGFPPGFKLSENTRVWDSTEVENWLEGRRQRAA